MPNRNFTFPQTTVQLQGHHAAARRAYDLFGNGKTALKATSAATSLAGVNTVGNPISNLANTVTRSWNDRAAWASTATSCPTATC